MDQLWYTIPTQGQHLLMALALGMPPGILIGFLIGYHAGKAQILERYLKIEVGWGPKSVT